jgi:hypothetical protein
MKNMYWCIYNQPESKTKIQMKILYWFIEIFPLFGEKIDQCFLFLLENWYQNDPLPASVSVVKKTAKAYFELAAYSTVYLIGLKTYVIVAKKIEFKVNM